ncbi:hypothetical protein KDW_05600 [Dictyobacter vulcani]|uniref:biotin carboxylase n=2 Tax=Dictyobacter vulcani TaxID=2607529 RepID=A0A5J4KCE8_9CHLR|nr:hypothetical protein KDW_05600 [Dictyobacter vulcani]
MRVVENEAEFLPQLAGAQREALAAFGDGTVFLERYLQQPRHIEIQILADTHGNIVHLGERECSIQRRHQKIVEESPSIALTPTLRAQMGAVAIRIARAANYVNAGTLEFMLDSDQQFYFLEMNTRLQVEHPVTELVTGLDLVRQQLYIASGEPLDLQQEKLTPRGHAIEVRLYAEDPQQQFLPSTGLITGFISPVGPGVRVDSGVAAGDEISQYYDPMLAKLIVYAEQRPAAIARLRAALERCAIFGVTTNISLLHAISLHPAFYAGETPTNFLELHSLPDTKIQPELPDTILAAAAITVVKQDMQDVARMPHSPNPWQSLGPWRTTGGERTLTYTYQEQEYQVGIRPTTQRLESWLISIDQREPMEVIGLVENENRLLIKTQHSQQALYVQAQQYEIQLFMAGQQYRLERTRPPEIASAAHGSSQLQKQKSLTAPMAGTIVKVQAQEGDIVEARQVLLILSAMKMEHAITAPYAGKIQRIYYAEGAVVQGGALVVEMAEEE